MVDSAKLRNVSKVFPAGPPCENVSTFSRLPVSLLSGVGVMSDVVLHQNLRENQGKVSCPWFDSSVSCLMSTLIPRVVHLPWVLAEDVFMLDVL
jgi:hypothetical protein